MIRETFCGSMSSISRSSRKSMNRRDLIFLPGAAAVMASGAFAQSQSDATIVKTPTPTGLLSPRKAMKAAARYGRAKYSYKVPKTAAKQAKYISFLSGLLTLSPAQQQQGASIFTAATVSRTALRNQVQTAHEALSEAVKTNNPS